MHAMQVYNSLSRKKEPLVPLSGKKVRLYVCGITPYDTTHLGHAFTYMAFDVLVRYLKYRGYSVTYTQNVTDIDDDILKRARAEKRDWKELGTYWTKRFQRDMKSLNILPPTHYVQATDSIQSIIHIIERLQSEGFAYSEAGTVYFHAQKFENYGKLSRFNEKQMLLLLKERGGDPDDPVKKHPLDFILWQKSKPEEPFWDSPWGAGRPGWHIECSAMVKDYLGEQIEIHGGGRDLIYPHHESEIAQSESSTGKKPFVKYWMHTGMVMYEGEKMSKSLGNLVMVADLLGNYSADAVRWVLLSHHYRQPWEFQYDELHEAQAILAKVKEAASRVNKAEKPSGADDEFIHRMDDDLDTPGALGVLRHSAERILSNKTTDTHSPIRRYLSTLGFSV